MAASSAALLAAGAVLSGSVDLRAVLVGGAAFVGLGAVYDLLLTTVRSGDRAIRQEMRDLWGLAHVAHDGRPWPAPGGWALGADALAMLIREMRARDSRTVLELGPGTSSVVIGAARVGPLRMIGLEHDERYVTAVAQQLAMHGIEYDLIHAPLRSVRCRGRDVSWYDPAALERVPSSLDVLIVDGPVNWDGGGNRSPAWPLLRERLRAGALVVVDDTERPDERAMVDEWLRGGGLRVLQDSGSFVALEVVG